jgi:hypothetical protein
MVMLAPHITDWCVIDMAFHLYRDDAEEPMSQECARDEMEAGEQATQVNCGITNTHIFFREVASRSAKISELIAMAQRLLLGTGKATLKHGLQHLHDMEWNITREHVRLCS